MNTSRSAVSRAFLPAGVFAAVLIFHFLWLGFFPERDPAQDRWAATVSSDEFSWLRTYVEAGNYWLGYSYGLSLAFAAVAIRRYRETRLCAGRNLAVGGVTFTGFLAVAGCYLIGCCGSPMLVVYLNLFGAAFLPWAKPLVAAITTATILFASWLLYRRGALVDGAGGEHLPT